MTYKEVINSNDFFEFLKIHLTINQQESMVLKFLIRKNVNELLKKGLSKQAAFRQLNEEGFLINQKKIVIAKKTIQNYYYETK